MPRSKNKAKNRRTKGSKNSGMQELSASSFVYNGPAVPTPYAKEKSLHTSLLTQDGSLLSSAGGIIQNSFVFTNPSSAVNWADYAQIFDEYRVLSLEFSFFPNLEDSLNTTGLGFNYVPIYSVIDRDSSSNLASYSVAANYESLKVHALTKRFTRVYKMSGINEVSSAGLVSGAEGVFLNTASPPAATGAIKLFATGLSNSVPYGRFILRYLVQFRGVGI